MSHELIATKLYRPSPRADVVSRPHLLRRLNDGLTRKLILISASAGSGKTTLVTEWVSKSPYPNAWISLDQGDNDPARFLAYLSAAIKSLVPQLDEIPNPLLHSQTGVSIEAAATHLINAMAGTPEDVILVLDDYHVIETRQIHQFMMFLIEHLPEHIHLCLVTRADPPIPLARLRALNQLVELRVAELSFSHEEAARFLTQLMGLELLPNDIVELERRTEGWITGLQLAALSLLGHPDTAQFISAFSGSHEFVADYLIDEILERQPQPLKDFLLQTSILERMNGPLCEAITGQTDGQQSLEYLHTQNIFVSSLDTRRGWYAYHHLFADLLRQRLHSTQFYHIPDLHRRAADWYDKEGLPEEAIAHLLAAGEFENAADHLAELAEAMLSQSRNMTLLKWVEQLPADAVRERPDLLLYTTWALMLNSYSLDAVRDNLQELEKIIPDRLLPLKAFAALFQGQLDDAHALAVAALDHLSEQDHFLHNISSWVVRMAEITNTDLGSSRRAVHQIAQSEVFSGNLFVTVMTLCNLGEFTARRGRLYEAQVIYQQALTLATPQPISGMALIGLGTLAREWNELQEAEELALKGIDLVQQWSKTAAIDGHVLLSLIHMAQNRFENAQASLEEAQRLALLSDAFDLDDQFVYILQARFWIMRGDLDRAERYLTRSGGTLDSDSPGLDEELSYVDYHLRHHQHLILVRLWMARRRYSEALQLLDQLIDGIRRFGWQPSRREIEVLALKALALHSVGRLDQALMVLEQALTEARPGGYIRTFADEGPAMAHLLDEATKRDIQTDYIARIQAAFSPLEIANPLLDPLTEREIEVLELIAEGLTNPQIADQLIVATGTVKAHTSGIYSKLGVTNRVQAVSRARELGLL